MQKTLKTLSPLLLLPLVRVQNLGNPKNNYNFFKANTRIVDMETSNENKIMDFFSKESARGAGVGAKQVLDSSWRYATKVL